MVLVCVVTLAPRQSGTATSALSTSLTRLARQDSLSCLSTTPTRRVSEETAIGPLPEELAQPKNCRTRFGKGTAHASETQ